MLFDIRIFMRGARQDAEFSFEVAPGDFAEESSIRVINPVQITGCVSKTGKYALLELKYGVRYASPCARCAEEIERETRAEYRVPVVLAPDAGTKKEMEKWDDYILIDPAGGILDLREIAETHFFSELPIRELCRADCKGLCPKCGINLNGGGCGCGKDIDPRLQKIKNLFEEGQ